MTDTCTLSPAAWSERAAVWQALAADARVADGVFADRPDVERRLRELIALEADCCPGWDLQLRRTGRGLELLGAGRLPNPRTGTGRTELLR